MRRAVCLGINYSAHPQYKLTGCISDARDITQLLLNHEYDNSSIRLLLDATKDRIIDNLKCIVRESQPGDRFYKYSLRIMKHIRPFNSGKV